jgi:hypothetical protein
VVPVIYYLCVPYGSHNKQRLFPLNSINRLGSVARCNAFPKIRTEFLYTILKNFILYDSGLKAQHVVYT